MNYKSNQTIPNIQIRDFTGGVTILIRDLDKDTLWDLASFCLRGCEKEDWYCKGDNDRICEAWHRKAEFLSHRLEDGCMAKIAYVEGSPVGFIEYYPIDMTTLEVVGTDIITVWCIDVKGGQRGKGIGRRLSEALPCRCKGTWV